MRLFKKPLFIILVLALIFAAAGIYAYSSGSKKSAYEFTTVAKSDITQIVSVTGRVKAAESVDLAFEKSGKVAKVNVQVGDKVTAGQILASLDNSDLEAQLLQARANLAAQQAKLDELNRGTRPEELQISQTTVDNAQKSVTDYEINLENVKTKAESDLTNLYAGVKDTLNDAYVKADDAVNKQLQDLFSNGATSNPKLTFTSSSQASADAEWKHQITNTDLALLKASIDSLSSSRAAMDTALANAETYLNEILGFLNSTSQAVNDASGLTPTTQTNYKYYVNTGRAEVNTAISSVNAKRQAITTQKATNQSLITTAQSSLNTAKNTLASAQDQLNLKLVGTAPEQINAQAALVLSARASVESAQAQINKGIVRSPIDGMITKQDTKVGQINSPNVTVISVMSAAQFEIEAKIPEADIAKVQIGNKAEVTLDTYGNSVVFEAVVVEIDPAETIVDGVATYKTTFQFTKEDERIKSGMTANIDIVTAQKSGVLTIPQRAVIQRGNDRFVLISKGGDQTEEIKITTGLKGSEGEIEIVSGLNEGDNIVSFGETK